MNNYKIGDILFFENYYFTDTSQSAKHFALTLLPPGVMNLPNSLLCCVITSRPAKYFSLLLLKSKYQCFNKDSFACFNRRDINSIHNLDKKNKQPLAALDKVDLKKSFKILKKIFYGTTDTYLVAAVIREWKKLM